MEAAAIETAGLGKTYRPGLGRAPVRALRDVSLHVERGVIFGLLGQNGAGKTTLVKTLLGLARPTAGTARVLGCDPADPAARRRIGFLPEAMRLPEFMKAEPFLHYMGALNGVDRATRRRRVPEVLERVGLQAPKKQIKEYSKGMQQRLGLAQAMMNDPDLLFLDEPTEGLDPIGRKQVRDLLLELRAAGKTIFLNAHVLSEVEQVCDQCLILKQGQVMRAGKPSEFTRRTGEYILSVAQVTGAVHAAAQAVLGPLRWDGPSVHIKPRDRAQLNELIDRLRAVPVEIEALEPVKSTLEEFFIEVITGKEAQE
jgi:ABC-2 type transport system ATP-binding protein